MENDRKFESVYSTKVRAGKRRTYFFDVRKTKGEDYFVTLTESTKKFTGEGYERHKIFLYKEDFNRFIDRLQETVNYVKTELMPDFDYDEYTRRQLEWEEKRALEDAAEANQTPSETSEETIVKTSDDSPEEISPETSSPSETAPSEESEDDMSW